MARTTLLPYQRETVRRTEEFGGRACLVLDPGLGKTICTLSYLARNPHAMPALVVCPAAVKYVWEHEAITHAGRRVVICEGQKPPRERFLRGEGGADIYVINYDILRFWVKYFKGLDIQTIVFDESQNLTNSNTKRTRAARQLAATMPQVLALSGTPLMNRPAELWPTLNLVRPDLYPSFYTFGHKYCRPRFMPWGKWEYKGAENLDVLHAEMEAELMIRFRKSDVLKDLPEKIRQVVPCPLTAEGTEEYALAKNDFMVWLQRQDPGKAISAKRSEAMVRVGYFLRLAAKHKLRAVVDWANNFLAETDEKLILFAYHKKMIAALKRRVAAKSVVIDGSVTGRLRHAAVEQFQKDKRTRVAINQLQAGGVGTTLTAASTVGFAELWWRPADFTQAGDRAHRIGQDQTVFENWLIAPGTVEEKLCAVLQEKQATVSAVLDGGAQDTDIDVFDKLLAILEEDAGLL